ncbi:hypothetical protein HELRODRAFT_194218 [Helobdella robusta]|uniref:Uncharacterized protein n=1 Tax=Helobdella robusta TaxID=6412 RepID=T1FVT6_HELRO|nr:hypothetical protein HELRODRAFT_194218 [Helobdella robusta]ESN92500.1 hypothetical protein HELRODRAFT_194218 [Helobdella robusta]
MYDESLVFDLYNFFSRALELNLNANIIRNSVSQCLCILPSEITPKIVSDVMHIVADVAIIKNPGGSDGDSQRLNNNINNIINVTDNNIIGISGLERCKIIDGSKNNNEVIFVSITTPTANATAATAATITTTTTTSTAATENYEGVGDDPIKEDDVLINVSNAEMNRRINAFMKNQRQNINLLNIKEFCHKIPEESDENSCARVEAVYKPCQGNDRHVSKKRSIITKGAQSKRYKVDEIMPSSHIVNERLDNLEKFLTISSSQNQALSRSYSDRLKNLEDRLIYLESLSPEYFQIPINYNNTVELL